MPLRALPITIESLDTGATRISFMKPNSLSQIIEMEEKTELNRIVMPSIPGKINCVYDTPVLLGTRRDMPDPTMKSQSSGRAIAEKRRLFSRMNFLNSRATIT